MRLMNGGEQRMLLGPYYVLNGFLETFHSVKWRNNDINFLPCQSHDVSTSCGEEGGGGGGSEVARAINC
jgi:hypothetical protein